MTSSVIITIVVVLGIIVAGGFLFYFLGDVFMGLAGKKKNDATVVEEKQLKEQKDLEARVEALENSEEAKKDPEIAAILYNGAVVEAYDPNEEEVKEEEVSEETTEEVEETEEVSDETVEDAVEPEETDEDESAEEETDEVEDAEDTADEDDDTAEFIRQRRAELMERLARMQAEQNATEDETVEEDSVDLSENIETEETEESVYADEEPAEETTEEVSEETVEDEAVEAVEETKDADATEEVETVEDDEEGDVVAPVAAGVFADLTMEELEARLADEQEKLKDNEKDLRQCKKEFIPLRRVKQTLERDENKLRRKEALVAKQKVVLYGVNNYADIDEEKAKKLAEDLDLLDGLKLSVQHCQEVMEKNEERYPLLEKIFTLLSAQNEELKADIKELEDAIAARKNDETPDEE